MAIQHTSNIMAAHAGADPVDITHYTNEGLRLLLGGRGLSPKVINGLKTRDQLIAAYHNPPETPEPSKEVDDDDEDLTPEDRYKKMPWVNLRAMIYKRGIDVKNQRKETFIAALLNDDEKKAGADNHDAHTVSSKYEKKSYGYIDKLARQHRLEVSDRRKVTLIKALEDWDAGMPERKRIRAETAEKNRLERERVLKEKKLKEAATLLKGTAKKMGEGVDHVEEILFEGDEGDSSI
ncbi:hypothetical protein BDV96DRAFT_605625 [Lophiotrema nucula]|uniref:Uncharacterized protein n=1 Tax=Lophiotrema nucula TaxID=690887 RepID=A0A6A5YNK9_9PLEO|nr:hypothetical protein BDV96DRAFT_605625 [Lophiotrema nucula]